MRITYAVALVNYQKYGAGVPSLERVIARVRERGFGVELWRSFGLEKDLYGQIGRKRLKPLLGGMAVSLHAANDTAFQAHQVQIEAAADFGAEVIVIHSQGFLTQERANFEAQERARGVSSLDVQLGRKASDFDVQQARRSVAYAAERGVKLALENGVDIPPFPMLANAVEQVGGLGICLDTGHLYRPWDPDPDPRPMHRFLDAFKERIIHLHIHDANPETTDDDHMQPGTGGISHRDWERLVITLQEVDFHGMAVFEIAPRVPVETASLGKRFMETLFNSS